VTIFSTTETALNTLVGIPNAMGVFLTASPDALPDEYLVYTEIVDISRQHADNLEKERVYTIQVSYYSRTGLAGMPDIDGAMTAAGFQRGPGRELPYDFDSRHHGFAKDYTILLNQN